jgi:hypothetical protein
VGEISRCDFDRQQLDNALDFEDGWKKWIAETRKKKNQLYYNNIESKKLFKRCLKGGHRDNCVYLIFIDQQ